LLNNSNNIFIPFIERQAGVHVHGGQIPYATLFLENQRDIGLENFNRLRNPAFFYGYGCDYIDQYSSLF